MRFCVQNQYCNKMLHSATAERVFYDFSADLWPCLPLSLRTNDVKSKMVRAANPFWLYAMSAMQAKN